MDPAAPAACGPELLGRDILYWWPDDGWQRGHVAKPSSRPPFTHVVAYRRETSALRGTVDTLLDRPSYGQRWVLLSPNPPSGVSRAAPRTRAAARAAAP